MTHSCSFPGCKKPSITVTLCRGHYAQRQLGRELTPLQPRNVTVPWLEAHKDYPGDECLKWPFANDERGRGYVQFRGKTRAPARAMCIIAHGEPPTPKHEAAHSCGKGHEGCVNPSHLRWALRTENMADMLIHGTRGRGESHSGVKLTERSVLALREFAHNVSRRALCDLFGVSPSHLAGIINRRFWGHI